MWNRYLDILIETSFQRVNGFFVLPFKDKDGWESCKQYYFPIVEIKGYNV